MEYKNEFKLIEGNNEDFENKLNELAKDTSWMYCSSMNTVPTREGMHYSMLMQRSVPIKNN